MPQITSLNTIDSNGNADSFIVSQEPFNYKGLNGIFYKITKEDFPFHKYFEFKTLDIQDNRILIYMINNHFHPELSNKGIVKAMVSSLSNTFHKNIVSSTNKEDLKIDETEGRIPDVTKYWIKWKNEMQNVRYDVNEDRYIYIWND